jgi:energy-coupling factor transport system ATP-binding protein
MARRRAALARFPGLAVPGDDRLAELAAHLGVSSPDQHLYELPLVARKRLSWLMSLTGAMPWVMLDEPSVGQDRPTRNALAAAISRLAALGHGVVFVTHDEAFAGSIAHRPIRLA